MRSFHRSAQLWLTLGAVFLLTAVAQAAIFTSTDVPINLPDYNQPGSHVSTLTINDSALTSITDVNVKLNFSTEYVSDIYCYLQFQPSGAGSPITVVLLDQIDWSDISSLNVTLDQSAANNIHTATITDGGTYLPDAGSGTLANYNGWNPNGTWYLYLDDMSSGGFSTLNSWSLEITAVPEPTTWAMAGFGVLFAGSVLYRQHRGG